MYNGIIVYADLRNFFFSLLIYKLEDYILSQKHCLNNFRCTLATITLELVRRAKLKCRYFSFERVDVLL